MLAQNEHLPFVVLGSLDEFFDVSVRSEQIANAWFIILSYLFYFINVVILKMYKLAGNNLPASCKYPKNINMNLFSLKKMELLLFFIVPLSLCDVRNGALQL